MSLKLAARGSICVITAPAGLLLNYLIPIPDVPVGTLFTVVPVPVQLSRDAVSSPVTSCYESEERSQM